MPSPSTPDPSDPTALDLERTRDLRGRAFHPWFRRVLVVAMAAIVLFAAGGGIGQPQHRSGAATPAARLDVHGPRTLRGGLLWPARVVVHARERLVEPQVVLGSGYVRGMQLNTLEPAPSDEAAHGASLALTYPTIEAGGRLTVYLQLQVNPDTVGRQDLSVVLRPGGDDPQPPVRVPASAVVLP